MNLKPGVKLKTPYQFFYSPYNEGCVKLFIPHFKILNMSYGYASRAYKRWQEVQEYISQASIWKGPDAETGLCSGYELSTNDLPRALAYLREKGYTESNELKHLPWHNDGPFNPTTEEECPWIGYTSNGSMCLACGNSYSGESLLLGHCNLCDTPFEDDPDEPLE